MIKSTPFTVVMTGHEAPGGASMMLIFFGFLFRAGRTSRKRDLAASFLMSVAVLITHPWTWVILTVVLAVYVALSALHARSWGFILRSSGMKILSGSLILGVVAFGLMKQSGLGQYVVDLGVYWALLENLAFARSPADLLRDVQIALYNYSTQGFFSNWIMIGLAVLGAFHLPKLATNVRTLIVSWFLGLLIPFLFLGWEIQWRLLFLLPYYLLAAMGLFVLSDSASHAISKTNSRADAALLNLVRIIFVASIIFLFVNNAVRSMTLISTQIVL